MDARVTFIDECAVQEDKTILFKFMNGSEIIK